jgi:hypothetical protein
MKALGNVICFNDMPKERPDFLEWRDQNPLGFVLNRVPRGPFKFHLASCTTLEDIGPEALANPKCCSPDRAALLQYARTLGRQTDDCPTCLP